MDAIACFFPGRAKDLPAPRHTSVGIAVCWFPDEICEALCDVLEQINWGVICGGITVCDELLDSKITVVIYNNCQVLKEVSLCQC